MREPGTQAAAPWLARAQERGWLPAGGQRVSLGEPSPLLAALVLVGALFCSLPLLAFIVLGPGKALVESAAGYVAGGLAMAAALWCLRSTRHIFATCMGLELWGLGLALVMFRWLDDAAGSAAMVVAGYGFLSAALLGGALLIPALWVCRLMGLALAPALMAALVAGLKAAGLPDGSLPTVLLLMALAAAWAWWCWHEARWLGRPLAPRCAALADGFAVGLLLFAAWFGSFSELSLRWIGQGRNPDMPAAWHVLARGLGVPLVLAGGWALARRWSAQPVAAGAGHWRGPLALACAALALAAWFSPEVAAVALVAALAAATARWQLLAACGVAALWLLSSFYYSLAWPLLAKGLGLAVLGAALLLGLLVWRPRRQGGTAAAVAGGGVPAPGNSRRGAVWLLLLGGVIALALANADVWRKEAVIAQGQRILVPLAPRDPRSLMQGDYMQLRFSIPQHIRQALEDSSAYQLAKRATVVAGLNERGVAELLHLARPGEALGEHEILLPLKQLKGDWVLVTDAYFFAEGQGRRFEQARFGDFRVLPDGRALLVGLADAQGQAIAAYARLPPDAAGEAAAPGR